MTSKITTLIKQYFFLLALLAMVGGFSAFKFAERFDDPEDGWYDVTIAPNGDPDILNDQLIGDYNPVAPPEEDEDGCAIENDGTRCAIHLTFGTGATSVPATVQAAIMAPNVTVGLAASDPQ